MNEILQLALRFAASSPLGGVEPAESLTDTEVADHDPDVQAAAIVAGLRALATWAERSAASISDLLAVSPDLNPPDDLLRAWRQLDIEVTDLADPGMVEPTISKLFEELLTHLREGRRLILEQRLLAEHPKTLEELGRIRGVTREAIRQDERSLKRELDDLLARPEFAPFHWRAWDLRHSLGTLAPAAAPSTVRALDGSAARTGDTSLRC